MYSATTQNIVITVIPRYESSHSDPLRSHFVFSYEIKIKNDSSHTVQLLKRHWIIKSADGVVRDVEGEGVIGEVPILSPGTSYTYNSWAPITCEIGEMFGTYLMKNLDTKEEFSVIIPKFQFVTDPLLN